MSYFIGPIPANAISCYIFGKDGAKREAERLGVAFLDGVPLVIQVRETSNAGRPVVATDPDSEHAKPYLAIAEKVWAAIEKAKAAATP